MAVVTGTGSANTMLVGSNASDYLEGGEANDTLLGLGGHDTLLGGGGDDVIYAYAGDSISGGAGRDVLYMVDDTPASLSIDVAGIEYVAAGLGNDTILGAGQTRAIEVYASGGDDSVVGGSGHDWLWGSVGNDTLIGNAGDDVIVGDLGADSLSGGDGNDRIYVDAQDTIDGGAGFDAAYISGGTGMAINLAATRFEWVTDFVNGNDTLDASGTTTGVELYAGGGNDLLTGGSGDDLVFAGEGADTLVGGAGDDGLIGEGGGDSISGGDGNDRIYADASDTVDGGDGYDIMYMVTDAAFTADLGAIRVEWLFAGGGNDNVSSSTATPIQVYANGGNDTVSGGGGNDTLWGGDGDDSLAGNAGADILVGGAGSDTINGGAGDDWLYGGDGADVFVIGADWGNDTIFDWQDGVDLIDARALAAFGVQNVGGLSITAAGSNAVVGYAGNTLTIVNAAGKIDAADLIFGENSAWVTLEGMAGSDSIFGKGLISNGVSYANSKTGVVVDLGAGTAKDGLGGIDVLDNVVRVIGSAYADSVHGGAADDWFQASSGNDTLDGATGVNTMDYGTLSRSVQVTLTGNGMGTAVKSSGTDTLSNISVIQGTYHSDYLKGSAGATQPVYLRGMVGTDTIDGAGNVNNIADYNGSSSPVTIDLAQGKATGAIGPDTLLNVVAVRGSWGNDTLKSADSGDFSVDGGGGSDTLDYSGLTNSVTVDYNAVSARGILSGTAVKLGGIDNFTNVYQILGTKGGDRLIGSSSSNPNPIDAIRLSGGAGNDTIDGSKSSLNRADYTDSPTAVIVYLQDSIIGSNWSGHASDGWGDTDTLTNVRGVYGSAYADSIFGSDQNDVIQGWYGNDTLDGGGGKDTALYWCNKAQAIWTPNNDGSWTITSLYGTDTLRNIEVLQFRDGAVQFSDALTPRTDWTLI